MILITRPEQDAQELSRILRDKKIDSCIDPCISFDLLSNYSINVGDYVYIYDNVVYGNLLVDNISESSNFIQINLLKNIYNNSSICTDESYTLVSPQSNILLMKIDNYNDECGICNGLGLNNDGCCGDVSIDCNNVCGGEALLDNCGVCDNSSSNDCEQDECGYWGGSGYSDECGTCDDYPSNDCVQDCNDDWGGSALVDDCGTCDNDTSNDCTQDCSGTWGGDLDIDE